MAISRSVFPAKYSQLLSSVLTPVTVANTTAITPLFSHTVHANTIIPGAIYEFTGYGVFSTTGTPNLNFYTYWNTVTAIDTVGPATLSNNVVNAAFYYVCRLDFVSTTAVVGTLSLNLDNGTTVGTTTAYVSTPIMPVAITTNTDSNIDIAVQWGTASASNTLTLYGGNFKRVV